LEKTEEQAIYILQLNEEIQVLKRENEALKSIICPNHPKAEICSQNKQQEAQPPKPSIPKISLSSQNPIKILAKLCCNMVNQMLLLNPPFSVVS